MVTIDDEDTLPTEDNEVLQRLRAEGVFDNFAVVDWAGASETGLVRATNEDRWARVGETTFVVADGMGGHDGGEIAADAVVEAIAAAGEARLDEDLAEVIACANHSVATAGAERGITNLGSTLVLVSLRGRNALVVGVGDSRVYRYRPGRLEQLTHDHTVRSELLEAGVSLESYIERGVRLDALTSYVGLRSERPVVGSASFAVAVGDRFLVCSDGVHGQLTQPDLIQSLGAESCERAVSELLSRAERAGGRDNATAVVVDIGLRTVE